MSSVKDALRRGALNQRAALTPEERKQKSCAAVQHLLQAPIFQTSRTVATYFPLKTELAVDSLLCTATDQTRRFVAPRALPNKQMAFYQVTSNSGLEPGFGNILQPAATAPQVDVEEIDLFLVPLAACDHHGNRLGFGGGFYDRTLQKQRGFKLGVGFYLQLVTQIESEPHDVPLDGFISENGILHF